MPEVSRTHRRQRPSSESTCSRRASRAERLTTKFFFRRKSVSIENLPNLFSGYRNVPIDQAFDPISRRNPPLPCLNHLDEDFDDRRGSQRRRCFFRGSYALSASRHLLGCAIGLDTEKSRETLDDTLANHRYRCLKIQVVSAGLKENSERVRRCHFCGSVGRIVDQFPRRDYGKRTYSLKRRVRE